MTTDLVPIRRALISVSDKTGLVAFARVLAERGVSLLSTGGTARALRDAGLQVTDVAEVTGFPEMMDGRVKTLHPKIHGGLLALRDDPEHVAAMETHGIGAIDLLVVNLYPFEETIAKGADYATCIENIDIGGPAMIRAAAKNHAFVTVLVDPEQYAACLAELDSKDGQTSYAFRQAAALTAYGRTATYDATVSNWLATQTDTSAPRYRAFGGKLSQTLRYGENPHQSASFYTDGTQVAGVATAELLQGKALSYNNINDTDAAFELVSEWSPESGIAACAIIKHANPSGVACGRDLVEAYRRARDCDRTSAFGGIVACNRAIDRATAEEIVQTFTEVVIAPAIHGDALEVFSAKPNIRVMQTGGKAAAWRKGLAIKPVTGGFLAQDRDAGPPDGVPMNIVTARAPTEPERRDLAFAWTVARHVKSNAIVYAKDGATVGIGAGQMSRVDSSTIAALKADRMAEALGLPETPARGSVVASDAFFPFADGLMAAADAGVTAVIQPGGSMRDDEVIAAADAAGLAMVFTGIRHFRH